MTRPLPRACRRAKERQRLEEQQSQAEELARELEAVRAENAQLEMDQVGAAPGRGTLPCVLSRVPPFAKRARLRLAHSRKARVRAPMATRACPPARPRPRCAQNLMQRMLAVRNAMAQLALQLDPGSGRGRPAQGADAAAPGDSGGSISSGAPAGGSGAGPAAAALIQDEAAVAAARQQLAAALGELPSLEQLEALTAQLPSGSSPISAAPQPTPAAPAAAAAAAGAAGADGPMDCMGSSSAMVDVMTAASRVQIEGHRLQELPPANNPTYRKKVQVKGCVRDGRWGRCEQAAGARKLGRL